VTLADRQKEIYGYLTSGFPDLGLPGWSARGAAAVVGNYTQENLARAVTTGTLDHGSQGLAQWRLNRLDARPYPLGTPQGLIDWCSHYFPGGEDAWKSLRAQCAFTLYETARDYPRLNAELRDGKKPIETLTANFCFEFERPAKQYAALDKRIAYAKDVFAMMNPQPSGMSPATTGGVIIAAGAGSAGAAAASTGELVPALVMISLSVISGIFSLIMQARKPSVIKTEVPGVSPFDAAIEDMEAKKRAYEEARAVVIGMKPELGQSIADLQSKMRLIEEEESKP